MENELAEIRANMADLRYSDVIICQACGHRFTFRAYPGGDPAGAGQAAHNAFLDGLAELESAVGVPAYGMWIRDDAAGLAEVVELWRVRDRTLVTTGTQLDTALAMEGHPCPARN